jgi:hypothetical protein
MGKDVGLGLGTRRDVRLIRVIAQGSVHLDKQCNNGKIFGNA